MCHPDTQVYERLWLEPLLTLNEVATVLGSTRKTVYRLVHKHELLPVRVEQRLRFEPAGARPYLERRLRSAEGGNAPGMCEPGGLSGFRGSGGNEHGKRG